MKKNPLKLPAEDEELIRKAEMLTDSSNIHEERSRTNLLCSWYYIKRDHPDKDCTEDIAKARRSLRQWIAGELKKRRK